MYCQHMCNSVLCYCIEQIQRKWKATHSYEYAAFQMIRVAHLFSVTWSITVQWRFNVPSSVAVMLMFLVSITECESVSFSTLWSRKCCLLRLPWLISLFLGHLRFLHSPGLYFNAVLYILLSSICCTCSIHFCV